MRMLFNLLIFYCSGVVAGDRSVCVQNCAFVLRSEPGIYQVIDEARAKERFSPFSTFKVANSLIALELGVVESLDQKLTFDQQSYPIKEWWPRHWYSAPLTLRDAFQKSAVPIYQQIASEIGSSRMAKFVLAFQFGNADISSGVDTFWLGESLKITAVEQVDFLYRLHNNELPVARKSINQLKKIMLVESTQTYKLYAKTGAGYLANGKVLGWYVGFVERNSGTTYFALNMEADSFDALIESRVSTATALLMQAGII